MATTSLNLTEPLSALCVCLLTHQIHSIALKSERLLQENLKKIQDNSVPHCSEPSAMPIDATEGVHGGPKRDVFVLSGRPVLSLEVAQSVCFIFMSSGCVRMPSLIRELKI